MKYYLYQKTFRKISKIVFLFLLFFAQVVWAVDIKLSGEPILLSGDKNDNSAYRFPTSTTFNNTPIDLILEVTGNNSGRDSSIGHYVSWSVLDNTISLWPTPASCEYLVESDSAWLDVKVTVVKKDTFEPLKVDQLAMSGFDIDTWFGGMRGTIYARDYIIAEEAHAVVLDSDSKLSYSPVDVVGTNGARYTEQLLPYRNDCIDTPSDPRCNGTLVYRDISSVSFRAYTKTRMPYSRLIGITFSAKVLDIYTALQDFGDAPESYGIASHDIDNTLYLGSGLFPDSETQSSFTLYADGDDKKELNQYDDDDAVTLNGKDFPDFVIF